MRSRRRGSFLALSVSLRSAGEMDAAGEVDVGS